jgi:hypothetical protein
MTNEKYNKLKQDAEELSKELRDVMIKLENRREKIKESTALSGIERNLYKHIESEISNAQGNLMIAQETLLELSEVEDEAELINYMSQYD